MEKMKFDNEILLLEVARLISGGHSVTILVRGNSMSPFLADRRDRVTLGSFAPDDLQPGVTVLARESGGRIVLHRIIARSGDRLILQGDGNLRQTEETAPELVMGMVTAVVRKGKVYAADGRVWRMYSRWWVRLAPWRRYLLAIYRRL